MSNFTIIQAIKDDNYSLVREIINEGNIEMNEQFSFHDDDDDDDDDEVTVFTYLKYYLTKGKLDVSFLEFLIENGSDLKGGLITLMNRGLNERHFDNLPRVVHQICMHIRKMVEMGADIHERDSEGDTILLMSMAYFKTEPMITSVIIDVGGNIDDESTTGIRAIHHAGMSNNFYFLEIIAKLSDVNSKDIYGNTPLHYIQSGIQPGVYNECLVSELSKRVNLLIENGADINAKNKLGRTPIFSCLSGKSLHIFIENGADIKCLDDNDETPLFKCKNFEKFKELIKNGVDVNHKNKMGMSVYDSMKKNNNFKGIGCKCRFLPRECTCRGQIISYIESSQKIAMWARIIMAKNKVHLKRMNPENLFAKYFSTKRMRLNGVCEEWVKNVK